VSELWQASSPFMGEV